jgi:uncharacterized protein (TIGR03663 family)
MIAEKRVAVGMVDPDRQPHWLDRVHSPTFPFSRETFLWAIIISLAVVTRLYDLGNRVMSHDEIVHALTAWQFFKGEGYIYLPYAHGPLQFHLLAFTYAFLGASDATSRVPAAFFGIAGVCLVYFFRRDLGRWGALAAAAGMVFSPYLLYYERYARNESFIVVWGLLTFLAVLRYLKFRSNRWLYIFTAVLALHFCTKETAFIYAAILAFYLILRLCARVISVRPQHWLRWMIREPEADVFVVLVITISPLLAGIPMTFFNLNPWIGGDPFLRLTDTKYLASILVCFLPLTVLSAMVGWVWDRIRFARVLLIFYGIFLLLYSNVFSSPVGWATGIIGGLNYWLAQQSVQRGGQPWYYYIALQIPLYEYLPALLTLIAPIPLWREWSRRRKIHREDGNTAAPPEIQRTTASDIEMPIFLLFWAVAALVSFSIAGEKMPWLTVHITLPCILIGGWVVNQLLCCVSCEQSAKQGGWMNWILAPILLLSTAWAIGDWLGVRIPFAGTDYESLSLSAEFICTVSVSLIGWVFLIILNRKKANFILGQTAAIAGIGWLFLLTIHTSLAASFANANLPNEFIYYAQFSPGVRTVIQNIETFAQNKSKGSGLTIVSDKNTSWTFRWYLREYPNVKYVDDSLPHNLDDIDILLVSPANWNRAEELSMGIYNRWEGVRIWWPNLDYMNLDIERATFALSDPAYREALWDIWYYRDFIQYSQTTHEEVVPENWPVAERMRMYSRP